MTPAVPTREAGRELDAEVAERVMGWTWRRVRGHAALKYLCEPGGVEFFDGGEVVGDEEPARDALRLVPRYSTDIAAAWTVVERLRTTDGGDYEQYWIFTDCCELGWNAELMCVPNQSDAPAPLAEALGAATFPLAICLAAASPSSAGSAR